MKYSNSPDNNVDLFLDLFWLRMLFTEVFTLLLYIVTALFGSYNKRPLKGCGVNFQRLLALQPSEIPSLILLKAALDDFSEKIFHTPVKPIAI
jgi:hypothetical protein